MISKINKIAMRMNNKWNSMLGSGSLVWYNWLWNLHKINRDEINKSADDEKDWVFLTKQILLSIENKSHDVTGGAGKQIRFSEHQRDKKKSTIQAQGNMYTKIESHCETILLLDEVLQHLLLNLLHDLKKWIERKNESA